MYLRLLQNRVFVNRDPDQDKTPGGIFIPDTAKEKPLVGTVRFVGQGQYSEDGKLRPIDLKVGDRVLFKKNAGVDTRNISAEHREVLGDGIILRDDDVLAVLE